MHIRRYLGRGLLITLPVFITLYLIFMVVRFIDSILGKVTNIYIKQHFGFVIPGIGFVLSILIIIIVGFIATNFMGKKIIHGLEHCFLKFPFIRQIYPAAKQIVDSFISKDSPAFKKVVLVEYPSKGLYAIGFVTNDSFKQANDAAGEELLHVLIATTPSPLTGYLALIPRTDVKFLDITVEEGVKLLVSGGIVRPGISEAAARS